LLTVGQSSETGRSRAASLKLAAGISLGVVAAYLVAAALGTAYRESAILDVVVSLALPFIVLSIVYHGSEKQLVFCVASLVIAGLCLAIAPKLGVPRGGLSLVLMTIGAMALPVIVDLFAIDMGTQIHVNRPLARMSQVAFLLALFPLAGWKLMNAHATILKEDERLVDELAMHVTLTAEGDRLVVDKLDRKTGDRALRRLAIRTKDKIYPLSDADVESVRETRTVRKTTNARGSEATETTREQEDRLRLILKLQGTGIPETVELFSYRGPLTIAKATVW